MSEHIEVETGPREKVRVVDVMAKPSWREQHELRYMSEPVGSLDASRYQAEYHEATTSPLPDGVRMRVIYPHHVCGIEAKELSQLMPKVAKRASAISSHEDAIDVLTQQWDTQPPVSVTEGTKILDAIDLLYRRSDPQNLWNIVCDQTIELMSKQGAYIALQALGYEMPSMTAGLHPSMPMPPIQGETHDYDDDIPL